MVFSTALFVFFFLPAFLVVYYLLPFRFRSLWILIASYVFYAWWRVDFLFLLIALTVWTHGIGRAIASRGESNPRGARNLLILGVALNLSVLGYFKYFNFGVASLDRLLRMLGGSGLTAWQVLLPIGISFYLFQATSYLVDVYRKDARPAESFIDLAAYIALFPQLIAGPIIRYKDIAGQLRERGHSFGQFSSGCSRFMLGFSKKVLIADSVAVIADTVFGLHGPTLFESWIGVLAFTVQIYFDFSGYSDMAIGLGRMMGFRFMENFNWPYVSRSITEFWRRWHISLSTWFRDYLYIPLGGNRKGRKRTYINLMLVMLLGGLWHGAGWTFVAWGIWHGILLMAERYWKERTGERHSPGLLSYIRTMLCVVLGWVLFRSPDFSVAVSMLKGMMGFHGVGIRPLALWQLPRAGLFALALSLFMIFAPGIMKKATDRLFERWKWRPVYAAPFLLFLFSVIRLNAETYFPFLYFQF